MSLRVTALLLAWFFSVYPANMRHGFQALAEFGPYPSLIACLKDTVEVEREARGTMIAGLCWPGPGEGDREPRPIPSEPRQ